MSDPVRIAIDADRALVAGLLARAFADDPAMAHVFPDPVDRARRLPRFFALTFDGDGDSVANAGMRLLTAGGEATTFWREPGRSEVSTFRMLLKTWSLWRAFGPALGRALAVSHAIAAHFPAEPFWYLHMAGCDPAMQGRGHGAAAVRGGLARIAGQGVPVYLETANPRNLGFYSVLGFTVLGEWTVPGTDLRFWSLQTV